MADGTAGDGTTGGGEARLLASAVAQRLGVSAGMVRRYGLALEAARGAGLERDPQRGRIYAEEDVRTLERARAWLRDHPGAGVEDAVRAVLGLDGREAPQRPAALTVSPEAVQEAVEAALARVLPAALAPLLEEVARLRAENAGLRGEVEALRALPPATGARGTDAAHERAPQPPVATSVDRGKRRPSWLARLLGRS